MIQKDATALRDHDFIESSATRVEINGPSVLTRAIRVAVVSRQRLVREALAAVLSNQTDIEIVGSTAPESNIIELFHATWPNVVLIDLPGTGLEDLDLVRTVQRSSPEAKVLLLAATQDEALICKALAAGARGYVLKEAGISELTEAIRGVDGGGLWIERMLLLRWLRGQVTAEVTGNNTPLRMNGALTAREQEILRLLALGGTNKEIAKSLLISDKTVKTHLNSIFGKLHVKRRLQAVLYALHHELR